MSPKIRRALTRQLESPNLHELGLDRVIAYGHTWSPTLELTPRIPLRHGHAITIDMAYSITLAHARGLINDAQRDQWFTLVTSVGLSIDHEFLTDELLAVATEAIKKTRDGKQRFAVPDGEFGKCVFLNDVNNEELFAALKTHKAYIQERYAGYEGKEAYVDAGDLGADVETYLNGTKDSADSLKRNGIEGDAEKTAAVKAGAVPVDGMGKLVNGVRLFSALPLSPALHLGTPGYGIPADPIGRWPPSEGRQHRVLLLDACTSTSGSLSIARSVHVHDKRQSIRHSIGVQKVAVSLYRIVS